MEWIISETSLDWYHRIKREHGGEQYFSKSCKCHGCSDSAICGFYTAQKRNRKKYRNLDKLVSINADLSKEVATPSLFSLQTNEIDGKKYSIVLSCISLKFRFNGEAKWHKIPWSRLKKAIQNTNETTT